MNLGLITHVEIVKKMILLVGYRYKYPVFRGRMCLVFYIENLSSQYSRVQDEYRLDDSGRNSDTTNIHSWV